uniref:Pentacotripeptide-repeat region of PRORP domain-containing protein n=1 Tax=Daucus carota subsp. sativus TaxID=79200 RepID=A0A164U4N2_DAUCS
MSKSVLSRIKPRHITKLKPSLPLYPSSTNINKIVNQVCDILRTRHIQWEQTLETKLSECEVVPSDIAHLVFDKIQDSELGLKFFYWVTDRPYGCSLDASAYSSLLKLLARFRVFAEIESLLESLNCEEGLVSCDAVDCVIRAYSYSGLVDKALEFYTFAIEKCGVVPSVVGCNAMLDVLVRVGRFDVARRIYDEMVERDNGSEDSFVDNYSTCIVLRGLCKEGKMEEGRKLIEDRWGQDCVPNVVFYNTLIDGYCRNGNVSGGYLLFKDLKRKGFLPTMETYGALVNGFCKKGDFVSVDKMLKDMKLNGLSVNVQVHNNIIDAQYKHGCPVKAADTLRKIMESGCEPNIVTYNTLIAGSCSTGNVGEAEQLLELGTKRGLIPNKYSYTSLIHVYCQQGNFDKASHLLFQMTEGGHKADLSTYGALVHGFVVAGEVDVALSILGKMMENGVSPDAAVYNVLISGLCKKGRLRSATDLLSEMLDRNILPDAFVYATVIDGFIRNSALDEAKKLFEQKIERVNGFSNNAISAISEVQHESQEQNKSLFLDFFKRSMSDGWSPQIAAYNSILICLCLYGMLKTALQMNDKMASKGCLSDSVTFAALLHCICLEGKSSEWESIMSCSLNGPDLNVALKYSLMLDQYLPHGVSSNASAILHSLVEDYRSHNQEVTDLEASAT